MATNELRDGFEYYGLRRLGSAKTWGTVSNTLSIPAVHRLLGVVHSYPTNLCALSASHRLPANMFIPLKPSDCFMHHNLPLQTT